jgi:hypothetical protein
MQGSVDYQDSITFLAAVAQAAHSKHKLMHPAAQVPYVRHPALAQAQLLEHACENISQLTAESITLWPSDISKALQPFRYEQVQPWRAVWIASMRASCGCSQTPAEC